VVPLLALVVYVHSTEIQNRNGFAAGLALYAVHGLPHLATLSGGRGTGSGIAAVFSNS